MRVHLGSDHAGLELKDHLLTWLIDHGHEAVDHGPFVYDADDDYPVFCLRAAEAVAADQAAGEEALGVVIGGSGNGEQMAANKVIGVRSALVWSEPRCTRMRGSLAENTDGQATCSTRARSSSGVSSTYALIRSSIAAYDGP